MTEVEKQKAKNTLIQAGAAFLQSPAGAPFLSKLAVATAGAAQAKLLLESAKYLPSQLRVGYIMLLLMNP